LGRLWQDHPVLPMNAVDFIEINLGLKPSHISYSAMAPYRPRFMATIAACRMNSEKSILRARHSDWIISKKDGLSRNDLISVCFHFDSYVT
jgi:hypothetical protein